MSSPEAYEDSKPQSKKILFRFCSECSNLLFPKEDKENNELLFACRTCAYTEKAKSQCVMRHDIASSVGDTAGITQDVAQDPTVGLSQSLSETSLSEIPGFCTMCGQEIFCQYCGEETDNGFFIEAEDDGKGVEGSNSMHSNVFAQSSHQKELPKHTSRR